MATYNVEFTKTVYVDFDVEAEDEEQAEEIAATLLEEAIWDGVCPTEERHTGIAQAVLFSYLGKTGNLMTSTQIYFKSFGKSLCELMDGKQRGFCEFIARNNNLISQIQARGTVWLSREFCADLGPNETIDQHAEEKIACCSDFWVSVVQYEDGTPVAEAITACSNSLYYALSPSDSAIYLPESGTLIYPKHWGMGDTRFVPVA